tara:strand:- start:17 stop:262 length:246 start_codon:yes stop_codon:yes gene_type:complete
MYTLQDAVKEREAADMVMFARQDKAEAARQAVEASRKEVEAILQANPQIGVMMKKGKQAYYVTVSHVTGSYKTSFNINDLV